MGRLVEGLVPPHAGGAPGLWLHAFAYARRVLLAGAPIPWLRPAELVHFVGQTHRLLPATVVSLPLAPMVSAWLDDPQVAAGCAGKRRPAATFKAVLADQNLRGIAADALRAAGDTGIAPLALVIPEPGRWAAAAHALVNRLATAAAEDDVTEVAAVYVADLLRAFADCGVAGVLIDTDVPPPSDELFLPILNIAHHYRWDVGLRAGVASPATRVGPFDFRIVGAPISGGISGIELPAAFWDGDTPPPLPERAFYFGDVPPGMVPEALLARLEALRCSGRSR